MKLRRIAAFGVLLLVLGCSKLTLDNYSRIAMGMTYDDVVKLIGAPASCDDVMGMRNCKWGDDTRSVTVSFLGGKVLLFASSNLH
jgi:hypothetical protein